MDVALGGLAEPFIPPAMDGREGLDGGGAIELRGPFAGGNIDFRAMPAGVEALVEFPDEAVEPSCFVGDLLGD